MEQSEINLALKKIELIQRHIKHVQEACEIIGKAMIHEGNIDFGVKLIANSYLHDNSKFGFLEFNNLIKPDDKDLLKLSIESHQRSNPHHPSYWGGIEEVPMIYLAELSADLFCRAGELGSSIDDFLTDVYFPKHGIKVNSRVYKNIKKFIGMLVEKFEKI